ncbi:serine hydrolase domain-containing protein [Winogradskyella luteola]|uniref:Beta-lactamase family protein n=1 Tax=Winogradskyella luteola TaxID=2828330 RepID=A0A9X1FC04_9FLAO|nr:serine hydrolase domain-containing protein [Winogradskyella luteola]MBV7270313.1 beta-lactamase family protein [Winogradskyella luteola]
MFVIKRVMVIIGIFFNILSYGQDVNKKQLDQYFNEIANQNSFMGGIAILSNDRVIYTRNIGHADIESNTKADINSKYRIGSISKTFTAVLTLKAIEQGCIDIDETLEKYFPSLNNADIITIEQLLYHRSGIYNFTDAKDYDNWKTEPKTRSEMIEVIKDGGSVFEPGTKTEYSNSNYVLLSYIIEDCFKMSYADAIQKHIAKPLNMVNTKMGKDINPKNGDCNSYVFYEDWTKQIATDMSIPLGAGAIITTPSELVEFSNTLFNGKLLDEKSLSKMKTIKENFGMGIFPINIENKTAFGHTGGIDGASALFSYIPEINTSYAIISNGSNMNNYEIATAVVKAIYNQPLDEMIAQLLESESKTESVKTYTGELDAYEGVYINEDLPFKLNIRVENEQLWAQATGQDAIPLERFAPNKFRFKPANIVLHFNLDEKTVTLNQSGAEFKFGIEKK